MVGLQARLKLRLDQKYHFKQYLCFRFTWRSVSRPTVSGTTLIANAVGIEVFATGGVGGVHRDAEKTFDVSGI